MTAILKTLPNRFARGQLERFLGLDGKPCWTTYYFTLGRGAPKRDGVGELYFTHRGRIIGNFRIREIVQNAGQLPQLTTLDGDPSEMANQSGCMGRCLQAAVPPLERAAVPRRFPRLALLRPGSLPRHDRFESEDMITPTPECHCPYCGKKLDRCSSVHGESGPKPGDFTLCFGCSLLMAFDAELRVRPLNAQELEYLLSEPELQEIVTRTGAAIRHMKSITSQN